MVVSCLVRFGTLSVAALTLKQQVNPQIKQIYTDFKAAADG